MRIYESGESVSHEVLRVRESWLTHGLTDSRTHRSAGQAARVILNGGRAVPSKGAKVVCLW